MEWRFGEFGGHRYTVKQFSYNLCNVARCIVLLKNATAIVESLLPGCTLFSLGWMVQDKVPST